MNLVLILLGVVVVLGLSLILSQPRRKKTLELKPSGISWSAEAHHELSSGGWAFLLSLKKETSLEEVFQLLKKEVKKTSFSRSDINDAAEKLLNFPGFGFFCLEEGTDHFLLCFNESEEKKTIKTIKLSPKTSTSAFNYLKLKTFILAPCVL